MKMNYEKEMASVLKQAMAESRRRGRAEEKLKVAMKMLETGICFEEIYMFTGMKKEEIMFELDGLISAVKQADRHEHQQAEWHESAESDASMDETDEPWNEAEAEGRETDRGEAGTRGCRTAESTDPWTRAEAEGRETGRGEAPWMNGSEDPWTEEDWMQGSDEAPWVKEDPEDWKSVAEDEARMNELSKERRTNGKVETWMKEKYEECRTEETIGASRKIGSEVSWMNERVGANVPNLWAKRKQGGKRHESEFPWRLGKMEDLLSGKRSKEADEETAGVKTTGMETAGVETVAINEELKELLVLWRREQCRTENVRAYMIIPQRTLLEIAAKIPKTREELMAVNGFGNARWEKYGERILQMTSGF